MTKDEGSTNDQMTRRVAPSRVRHSDFVIPSSLAIRHSSFSTALIATGARLAELLTKIEPANRVAIDTEADSLHSYREKLCLLQTSVPGSDSIVDPLANLCIAPLLRATDAQESVV